MSCILTLDLGTTYFKFVLFNRDGELLDVVRIAPPISNRQAGYMELATTAFTDMIAEGIAQLHRQHPTEMHQVDTVTFATQTNSFLLLDAADGPLTPIILWPDGRAAEFEETLQQHAAALPKFTTTTGIPGLTFEFMLAKLLWLRHYQPRTWQQMRKLCLISDYLGLLLTGCHATEAGAAGLTGLVDVRRCQWWPEMLAHLRFDPSILPQVVRAGTDLGVIRPAAADRFGLPHTCRFVVGCLDQYAGAIGVGNIAPGGISETTGTVLATVYCTDCWNDDPGPAVFQGPAFAEGLYYQMAFGDVSANCLEWYRKSLPEMPNTEDLIALAATVAAGADGLRLPLARVRITLAEAFRGLTAKHSRGQITRCILEAVAAALREQVRALCRDRSPVEIRSAGGAARSDLWLQIKADLLGVPVTATQCPEPTSLGAAVFAEAALSGASVSQIAGQWIHLGTPHLPDPQRCRRYRELYGNLAALPPTTTAAP